MKMSGWFVAPVVLGAALMLGGCCGGKIADCNKIITSINKNGEEIKKATDEFTASKKAAADVDKFSKTIDKVGDEVKAIDVKDETLKASAKEYHDMLEKLAKAAKDVNSTNPTVQAKALADLNSIDATETQIINKINGYCGAK